MNGYASRGADSLNNINLDRSFTNYRPGVFSQIALSRLLQESLNNLVENPSDWSPDILCSILFSICSKTAPKYIPSVLNVLKSYAIDRGVHFNTDLQIILCNELADKFPTTVSYFLY